MAAAARPATSAVLSFPIGVLLALVIFAGSVAERADGAQWSRRQVQDQAMTGS
jgi:hypothetical protein